MGDSTQNAYRDLELGDWGEPSQTSLSGSCDDVDMWLVRSEGVDYLTGTSTQPGNSDNITVVEFDCNSNKFQETVSYDPQTSTVTSQGVGYTGSVHRHQLGVTFGGFDIGDMDDDGIIDVVAINQGNTENVSYATITLNQPIHLAKLRPFSDRISHGKSQ